VPSVATSRRVEGKRNANSQPIGTATRLIVTAQNRTLLVIDFTFRSEEVDKVILSRMRCSESAPRAMLPRLRVQRADVFCRRELIEPKTMTYGYNAGVAFSKASRSTLLFFPWEGQ
jgi:hypothetical protein